MNGLAKDERSLEVYETRDRQKMTRWNMKEPELLKGKS